MGMNIGFHCVYPSLMQKGSCTRISGQKIVVPSFSSVPTKTPFSTCEKSKKKSTPNSSATVSGIKSSPPSVEDDTSCVLLPPPSFSTHVLSRQRTWEFQACYISYTSLVCKCSLQCKVYRQMTIRVAGFWRCIG